MLGLSLNGYKPHIFIVRVIIKKLLHHSFQQIYHYWWNGLWLAELTLHNPLVGHQQRQLHTAVIWIVKCWPHCVRASGQWCGGNGDSYPQIFGPVWIHFRYLQYWPWTMGDKDLRAAAEDRNMTSDKWNYYCRPCGPEYPPHQSNKTATSFNCDKFNLVKSSR